MTASINSLAGPFAPGRRPRLDENSMRHFRFVRLPTAIQDEDLMPSQHGFGDDGTKATSFY
jgi:hypothetical protein